MKRQINNWSKYEINFVKENYVIFGAKHCADYLNRSILSVRHKFYSLHLKPAKKTTNVTCDYCCSIYTIQLCKLKRNINNFCSKKCYAEWRAINHIRLGIGRKRVVIQCDYCKKDIEQIPSAIHPHNFCNRKCKGKWHSINFSGENNPTWRSDLTKEERAANSDRNYNPEYQNWRKEVFERDNWNCQITGIKKNRKNRLNAHHLFSWVDNLNLRFDVNNGISLIEEIHDLFHTLYGKGLNTKEQFLEFKTRYDNGEFNKNEV